MSFADGLRSVLDNAAFEVLAARQFVSEKAAAGAKACCFIVNAFAGAVAHVTSEDWGKPQLPAPRVRTWIQPFPTTIIPPGETVLVQTQPQCRFRGGRLIIVHTSQDFFVRALLVGQRTQLPLWEGFSSLYFSTHTPHPIDLEMDVCDPALSISIQVENRSREPIEFVAAIEGKAAYE